MNASMQEKGSGVQYSDFAMISGISAYEGTFAVDDSSDMMDTGLCECFLYATARGMGGRRDGES